MLAHHCKIWSDSPREIDWHARPASGTSCRKHRSALELDSIRGRSTPAFERDRGTELTVVHVDVDRIERRLRVSMSAAGKRDLER
jgi:hypothetical protein